MHVKDINSCKHVVPYSFFGAVSIMYVDLQSDVATSCVAVTWQWCARDMRCARDVLYDSALTL